MFNFLFSLPPSITKPHKSASQYPYKVAGTDIKDQNFLWFLQLINIQKKIKFITDHLERLLFQPVIHHQNHRAKYISD